LPRKTPGESPGTPGKLMRIDGNDWHTLREIPISRKLPPPVKINDGKYVHFRLENALSRNFAGFVHCDSDYSSLLTFTLPILVFYQKT
jgi:hypothetical protein